MLQTVQSTGCLRCRGVVGFWRANSVGDDIEIYNDNGVVVETFRGLRQQVHASVHVYWYNDSVCTKVQLQCFKYTYMYMYVL